MPQVSTVAPERETMGVPDFRLGIDLGGTKIHAVVVDSRGRVLGCGRAATGADDGYAAVLGRVAGAARTAVTEAGGRWKAIDAVGLGVPGPVDPKRGLVHLAANLGWGPSPVGEDLGKLLDRPVVLGNDVNCGALGEITYGCASGVRSAFLAFVGTGLGGAYVRKGKVVNGTHGCAGEIGHLPAPFGDALCGCGRRGCLETTASRSGIVRLLRESAALGRMAKVPAEGPIKSSALRKALEQGCPVVEEAVERCAKAVAWGLATVGHVVDPALFILGGGVAEALGEAFVERVAGHVAGVGLLYARRRPDIRLAALGDDAVAVGAAVAAGRT
jgi:glucokinase